LQQEVPEDFVIATGIQYSVREFIERAANILGITIHWSGDGLDEKGYDQNGKLIIEVDPRYFRPTEVETLLGDASKAREKLGWSAKISFTDLVDEMVSEDMRIVKDELAIFHDRLRP
jgi:GDPmannose 4,6-dehydratase